MCYIDQLCNNGHIYDQRQIFGVKYKLKIFENFKRLHANTFSFNDNTSQPGDFKNCETVNFAKIDCISMNTHVAQ